MDTSQIDQIRSLIQKGTRRLNKFFYAGVVTDEGQHHGILKS